MRVEMWYNTKSHFVGDVVGGSKAQRTAWDDDSVLLDHNALACRFDSLWGISRTSDELQDPGPSGAHTVKECGRRRSTVRIIPQFPMPCRSFRLPEDEEGSLVLDSSGGSE
jgi:hypothetical protein